MDDIVSRIRRQMEAEEACGARQRVGKSAASAHYQPGARIVWKSPTGHGPYTSLVLGSELQSTGTGYWCETAPESASVPTHLGKRYWVYPNEIQQDE